MMLDKKIVRQLYLLLIVLSLTGCGASRVSVTADIPQPLVTKLPLTGYLSFTEEFKNYRYSENEKSRSLASLSFGPAQQVMFERVFVQLLDLSSTASAAVDVIIEPEILDFQYTSPSETKLNLYEVWLRYRVKITDSQDKILADWVVKGYGKTPTATLKTTSSAFNAATNIALRDVGAQLAIGFPNQSSVQGLLTPEVASNNINQSTGQTEETETVE